MKILFTGGGTAGHILPIIAIVREIRRIYPGKDLKFAYIGPKDEFGSILLSQEGIEIKTIMAGKLRRYLTIKSFFQNLVDIFFKIPIGIFQSFLYCFFKAPDIIFSKGGYGSLAPVFSGWLLQTPILLHESDIVPGVTNKILSKFSFKIFTSFPKTTYFSLSKTILAGNPIRKEILEGSKEEAKRRFRLMGDKPLLLILGGSQGAQPINDLFLNILPDILDVFELIHQCGEKNFEQVRAEARVMISKEKEKYYHLKPFFKEQDIKNAYQACDLIISRAGSGSIFEIAALGKPSILIPLSSAAQNHQIKNAYAYAENGATIVIEQTNLTPRFFLEKLKNLFSCPEELEKMAEKAKEFSRPKATKIIAEYIIKCLQ